jgi:hypothetical protein
MPNKKPPQEINITVPLNTRLPVSFPVVTSLDIPNIATTDAMVEIIKLIRVMPIRNFHFGC